jgi:DNA-directed RNA polymerase sigma subunit (sigma70/sigma32)
MRGSTRIARTSIPGSHPGKGARAGRSPGKRSSKSISGSSTSISDLEHETSLLSPKEELRIAANIKKCENKAEAIRAVLSEISRDTSKKKSTLKKYPVYTGTDMMNYMERMSTLSDAYVKRSSELKNRFIKSNLKLVISIAKNYMGRGLPLADLIQ